MTSDDKKNWLIGILPRHERLTAAVVALLTNLLNEKGIEYLSVTGRFKELDSALEKIQRKRYSNPLEQLTDLSGIRVLTYLESQVNQITESIRKFFDVDERNSLDRAACWDLTGLDTGRRILFVHLGRYVPPYLSTSPWQD